MSNAFGRDCLRCVHADAPMNGEPCRSCIGRDESRFVLRPGFESDEDTDGISLDDEPDDGLDDDE